MPPTTANIRIRPIRFGFLVDPKDSSALRSVFQLNTVLWGGVYNFIIPVFTRTPPRYREQYLKTPPARGLINGLVEAFQPDFLIETKPGLGTGIRFDTNRIIPMRQFASRDDQERCAYGIDIRTVCGALYDDMFRFVQRHPPKVVLPHISEQRYELLLAATYGEFPTTGVFADCVKHYRGALDATVERVDPTDFHRFFQPEYLFPLRIGNHELETTRKGWTPDPQLFYMDEKSSYDLIEFWNLRAIGWRIKPLPSSLADNLKDSARSSSLRPTSHIPSLLTHSAVRAFSARVHARRSAFRHLSLL